VHPSGNFFYTINGGSDNVSAHAISLTGLVTAVTDPPFSPSNADEPTAVTVSPDGRFLFVASRISNNVSVLSIDQNTGTLAEISSIPNSLLPAAGPTAIAVHPSGNLLFVTNNNGSPGTLSVFIIDSIGSLTPAPGSPFPVGLNPQALALNATGTVVYVANKGANSISALSIDQNTGVLSLFDTEPLLIGTAPSSVTVGPGGQFLYVTNSSGAGTIDWLTIDPVTGELSAGGTAATVANPQFIRIDPAGKLLYATNSASDLVSIFSINPIAGPLTFVGERPMRDGPGAVAFVSGSSAISPTPTFAYVANAGGNTVSAFAITPATGLLTELVSVGSPFSLAPGTNPQSVAADPFGRYLFVVNQTNNTVSGFTIASGTGGLTAVVPTASTGTAPRAITVEPSGRFAYVANQGSANVSAFSISPADGVMAPIAGSPFPLVSGTNPQSVATDPLGRYLYVVNQGSNDVSVFSINSGTGALTAVGSTGAGTGPRAITVEDSGGFAYVPNSVGNTVSAFAITPATGLLTELVGLGSPFSVAAGPGSLSVDPLGRFLYVASGTSNNVSAFTIQATGALVEHTNSPFTLVPSTSPQSITVDLSGRFVYVANGNPSNNVSAFAIQADGGLSAVAGSPFAAGLNPSAITTVGRF
jgi:YVTN family beta-propeller protein